MNLFPRYFKSNVTSYRGDFTGANRRLLRLLSVFAFTIFSIGSIAQDGAKNSSKVPLVKAGQKVIRFSTPNDFQSIHWLQLKDLLHKNESIIGSTQESHVSHSYIYYDTSILTLLTKGLTLSRRSDNIVGDYNQGYFKFDIDQATDLPTSFDVKKYRKTSMPSDKHPILGKVKRSERTAFLSSLKQLSGVELNSLHRIFNVSVSEQRLSLSGNVFANIGLLSYSLEKYGIEHANFQEIQFTMPTPTKDLPGKEIKYRQDLLDQLQRELPILKAELRPVGKKLYGAIRGNPILSYIDIEYPVVIELIQLAMLIVLCVLVLFVLFRRRLLSDQSAIPMITRSYLASRSTPKNDP